MSIPGPDRRCRTFVSGFWLRYVAAPRQPTNKSHQGRSAILSNVSSGEPLSDFGRGAGRETVDRDDCDHIELSENSYVRYR
jgi:hypothetical protein